MLNVFGERWYTFSEGKQNQIVDNWRNRDSDEALIEEALEHLSLDAQSAVLLVAERPEPGYCSLSLKAIAKLMPLMLAGKSLEEAETTVYGVPVPSTAIHDLLPAVRGYLPSLRNPALERALTEMRKVVNAIIREHGKPYEVNIELTPELKKSREERVRSSKANRKRLKEREEMIARITLEGGLQNPSQLDIEKAFLQVECGGICPYTGRSIPFSSVFRDSDFDIEHIIPGGRYSDDSYQNKTLCYLPEVYENKGRCTPFEAYSRDEKHWTEILDRIRAWPVSNSNKLERFMLRDSQSLEAFIARQVCDTRNASNMARRLLESLYGGRTILESGVIRFVTFASKGPITATLRRVWGLEAILEELVPAEPDQSHGNVLCDHRHHAIDAIVIAIARHWILEANGRESSLVPAQNELSKRSLITSPLTDFVASIRSHIRCMAVSQRPKHKIWGELHKGSNYPVPYTYKGKPTIHKRCSLADLTVAAIEADDTIVDPAVRNAIRSKLEELGGNPKLFRMPENLPSLATADGRNIPIRKVRIRETKHLLKVGNGMRERFVASGGIHHVALFSMRDKSGKEKWDSIVIQITDAYERLRNRVPIVSREWTNAADARFLFSMMRDDTIEITDDSGSQLFRVKKFGAENKQVWLVPLSDAHSDSQQRKLGIMWSKSPNFLKRLTLRKVVVDLLGRVHPAND
jgi:CRISPR-associated endonuclease Csn1